MLTFSFCFLKLQNNIICRNIGKFFRKPIYCKQLLFYGEYFDNSIKRCIGMTNILLVGEDEEPTFFKPSRMMVKKDGSILKKPRPTAPKILVKKLNGELQKMFLPDAERYAKRNNLMLEKIKEGIKSDVYQVFEKSIGISQEVEKQKLNACRKKKQKTFMIQAKVSDHDLETKTQQIFKLLEKNKEVFLHIVGDSENLEKLERITKIVNEKIGNYYKIENMSKRKTSFVCNILPERLKGKTVDIDAKT